jgi:hypothetical protein
MRLNVEILDFMFSMQRRTSTSNSRYEAVAPFGPTFPVEDTNILTKSYSFADASIDPPHIKSQTHIGIPHLSDVGLRIVWDVQTTPTHRHVILMTVRGTYYSK